METEVVFTQDLSSNRIHKRVRTEIGTLMSYEACNLDDAGDFRVVTPIEIADASLDAYCARCFPTAGIIDAIDGEP